MEHARNVDPAELVQRRIRRRIWRLAADFRVELRLFELKVVPEVIGRLARRLHSDRAAGQPRATGGGRQVEGEQSLAIAAMRDEQERPFFRAASHAPTSR